MDGTFFFLSFKSTLLVNDECVMSENLKGVVFTHLCYNKRFYLGEDLDTFNNQWDTSSA